MNLAFWNRYNEFNQPKLSEQQNTFSTTKPSTIYKWFRKLHQIRFVFALAEKIIKISIRIHEIHIAAIRIIIQVIAQRHNIINAIFVLYVALIMN